MDLDLKNKMVLVTGGSHGLGEAICRGFAMEGANVAVNYHSNKEIAENFVREIEHKYKVRSIGVFGDISSENNVKRIFDETENAISMVDILINNAAISIGSYVKDTKLEIWQETIQVNLTGTFLTSREYIKRLLDSDKKGRIINISTTSAYMGSTSGRAHYDASKGGVISFTKSLAKEVAKNGITVNALLPGLMVTKMTRDRFIKNKEKYLATIPMGRYGELQEVADVVVFMASGRTSYMTGSIVNVSGGLYLG